MGTQHLHDLKRLITVIQRIVTINLEN